MRLDVANARDPAQRRVLSRKDIGDVGSALSCRQLDEGGRGGGTAVYSRGVVFRLEEAIPVALLGVVVGNAKSVLVCLCVQLWWRREVSK